jgi:hypothetical protein
MTIDLPPEIEARLLLQAEAQGFPLPLCVQRLLKGLALPTPDKLSPAERAADLRRSRRIR